MSTILVLDDNAALRRLLLMLFRTSGYIVKLSIDGVEGLEALASSPDLIVLDLMMPRMDGEAFIYKAREKGFTGPTILLSASPWTPQIATNLGLRHMRKPFLPEDLLDLTAELLANLRSTVHSPTAN